MTNFADLVLAENYIYTFEGLGCTDVGIGPIIVLNFFRAMKAVTALTFFSWLQVGLGITTLLTYVPVSIAAMHQANALVTLSSGLWLSHELKNMKFDAKLAKLIRHVPK